MGSSTSKLRNTDIQPLVFVEWESRTAAFDRRSGVEKLIKKASEHFKLRHIQDQLVLQIEIRGKKVEVTEDVLQRFPDRGTMSLIRIPGDKACKEGLPSPTLQGSEGFSGPGDSSYDPHSQHSLGTLSQPPSCESLPGPRLRKPVIYLFPPHEIPHATVSVSVVPQLSFTHVYPQSEAKILQDGRQSITWSVCAGPDGTLVETGSGLELSYLFWEASSKLGAPPSPKPTPAQDDVEVEHFDPTHPSLNPDSSDSVLIPYPQLLPYLDSVLRGLTLHTAARNDFITYWLPALSKKPYIALRFLPQAVYERAAELKVTPTPDVITRIFMLFRGVDAVEVDLWTAARNRAGQVDWQSVVGVRRTEATDGELFRVLEWGGVEVL